MRGLGSLNQFIQPASTPLNQQKQTSERKLIRAELQNNKKRNSRKRWKTNIEDYVAQNKKLLMKNYQIKKQESQQIDYIKELNQMYKASKYRSPINSIVIPKKLQVLEIKEKSHLKIEQPLLRAVQRIKVNEEKQKKIPQKLHQSSFLTYSQTIERLKLLPIQSMRYKQQGIDSLNTPKFIIRQKRTKTSLSDTKRVQYQKCLSWAKKHNKDSNYYKKQLGKIKYKFDWNGQVKQRKKLLSVLGQKYSMKRLYSQDRHD